MNAPDDVAASSFEEQHEKNMHILGLIRDEPAWALIRILRCEKLEAALKHALGCSDPAMVRIAREALKP